MIYVRIEFLLNIVNTNGQIKTKFCIHIIIDLHWYCISLFFAYLQQSYGPCLKSEFSFCSIS